MNYDKLDSAFPLNPNPSPPVRGRERLRECRKTIVEGEKGSEEDFSPPPPRFRLRLGCAASGSIFSLSEVETAEKRDV